jgi:putative ABC transport system permease protein
MVSIGGGAREQVVSRIRSLGANLIVIVPGNIRTGGMSLGAGAASSLSDDDARAVETEVDGVAVTAPFVRASSQVVAGGANWQTLVNGVDQGFFEAREWDVGQGRGFSAEELARGAQVAILGQSVAQQLYSGEDPLGTGIRLRNVPFTVVGVLEKKGQSGIGTDQDDIVLIPINTARQRVIGVNRAKGRAVHGIYVKMTQPEGMSEAEDQMKVLLRQRHHIGTDQEDDFQTRNLTEITATVEATAKTLQLLLAAVAGLSLAVGGIGIMNIMLVSVTERTREIGLRLAVGARRRDVMRQFLIEAATLAAIGGAIGVALGLAAAQFATTKFGWPLLIEIRTIVLAVAFSGFVGLFFGWYPAKRASRLDPVEALRAT